MFNLTEAEWSRVSVFCENGGLTVQSRAMVLEFG